VRSVQQIELNIGVSPKRTAKQEQWER